MSTPVAAGQARHIDAGAFEHLPVCDWEFRRELAEKFGTRHEQVVVIGER